MKFADPWFLSALVVIPLWLWRYMKSEKISSTRFSDTGMIKRLLVYKTSRVTAHIPFALRIMAVTLVIFALARPQTGYREEEIISKGIDIMLTLDLSSSMSASDLKPNRINAAKRVISRFIAGRTNDRIGLVVFAAEGYTQCPLTLDYPALQGFLKRSEIGMIEDGTAIGMALATAANRLKDSEAKSKIIVLLTDGVNNKGAIDPATAAQMAKAVKVKVYSIGVGKEGIFYQTVNDPNFGPRRVRTQTMIDETLLKMIAKETGGKYFRAQNEKALEEIYKEIDKLEKTDIKTMIYLRHTDWFMWLVIPALLLLALELVWPITPWRVIP